jgi:arsenical pump membrane protein
MGPVLATVLSIGIFGIVLTGVLTRPKGISEAWFAGIGGVLLLLLGLVKLSEAEQILQQSGDVLLFLLFLMALSALVDTSGFFDWAATLCARAAKGNARRLLIGVFLLGAAITTLLSLDTTALLLTPLVWAVVARVGLPPKPYLFACAFVANIASSALPVANLTNLLAFNRLGVSTARYVLVMTPVTVLASLTALGILLWRYRKELPDGYDAAAFPDPLDAVPHLPYFRVTLIVLGLTLLGYFVGPAVGLPLWAVAAIASVVLAAAGRRLGRIRVRTLATRGIAWSVFPFVIGMFLVIRGVENIGLATWLGSVLHALGGESLPGRIFAAAFGTAVGSNLVNNIPMVLLALSALGDQGPPSLYAAVLGTNLGPNITIVGSLATMLWRSVLGQRGLNITPGELAKAGLLITIPSLLVACLTLWLMLLLLP